MASEILDLLNFIEDTKEKVSLVDYLRDRCELIEIGSLNVGFSPFDTLSHDNYLDRRLIVSRDRYLCVETGESGDILDYMMHEEKRTFREAIEEMSRVAGVTIPDIAGDIEKRVEANAHKDKLYHLMRDTALHFFTNLKDDRAKIAVDYLEKRGFGEVLSIDKNGDKKIASPIVRQFALGYSLDETSLVDAMLAKGYTIEEMDECGLVYLRNGRAYDIMAGRLIIPIVNRHGKVIAFSGRIFEAKGHQKYRNTGNTILFSKKNEIYGANNLPQLTINGKVSDIFVVEGYMDVISLFKEGVKNAVASMGTALTSDHARILKNYSDNIYLTYDGDNAGQDAIRRGVDVLYAEGVEAKVITLPSGQDPDEIIKAHGLDYFLELKREARNMIEYKVDDLARSYNLEEAGDRGEYAVKAISLLCTYLSKVEAEEYLARVSEKSGIGIDILRSELYMSTVTKLNKGAESTTEKLTAKEKGLVYILYAMLRDKGIRNISVFLDTRDEKIAYDYMRLMGDGVSEEEFSETLDSGIALSVAMLRNMGDEKILKASSDSMASLTSALIKKTADAIAHEFEVLMSLESSDENKEKMYILSTFTEAIRRLQRKIIR